MHSLISFKIIIEKKEKINNNEILEKKKKKENIGRKVLKEFKTEKTEDLEWKLRFLALKTYILKN